MGWLWVMWFVASALAEELDTKNLDFSLVPQDGLSAYTAFQDQDNKHEVHENVKTIIVTKKVPVPFTVQVERKVPYPVKVPVRRPYAIFVPKPYLVEIPKPVPYAVKVPVPQPYTVEKHVPYPYKVHVDKPYPVQIPKPFPVVLEKKIPYTVEKPVPVQVGVPVERPVPFHVPIDKPSQFSLDKHLGAASFNFNFEKPFSFNKPLSFPYIQGQPFSLSQEHSVQQHLPFSAFDFHTTEASSHSTTENPEVQLESQVKHFQPSPEDHAVSNHYESQNNHKMISFLPESSSGGNKFQFYFPGGITSDDTVSSQETKNQQSVLQFDWPKSNSADWIPTDPSHNSFPQRPGGQSAPSFSISNGKTIFQYSLKNQDPLEHAHSQISEAYAMKLQSPTKTPVHVFDGKNIIQVEQPTKTKKKSLNADKGNKLESHQFTDFNKLRNLMQNQPANLPLYYQNYSFFKYPSVQNVVYTKQFQAQPQSMVFSKPQSYQAIQSPKPQQTFQAHNPLLNMYSGPYAGGYSFPSNNFFHVNSAIQYPASNNNANQQQVVTAAPEETTRANKHTSYSYSNPSFRVHSTVVHSSPLVQQTTAVPQNSNIVQQTTTQQVPIIVHVTSTTQQPRAYETSSSANQYQNFHSSKESNNQAVQSSESNTASFQTQVPSPTIQYFQMNAPRTQTEPHGFNFNVVTPSSTTGHPYQEQVQDTLTYSQIYQTQEPVSQPTTTKVPSRSRYQHMMPSSTVVALRASPDSTDKHKLFEQYQPLEVYSSKASTADSEPSASLLVQTSRPSRTQLKPSEETSKTENKLLRPWQSRMSYSYASGHSGWVPSSTEKTLDKPKESRKRMRERKKEEQKELKEASTTAASKPRTRKPIRRGEARHSTTTTSTSSPAEVMIATESQAGLTGPMYLEPLKVQTSVQHGPADPDSTPATSFTDITRTFTRRPRKRLTRRHHVEPPPSSTPPGTTPLPLTSTTSVPIASSSF